MAWWSMRVYRQPTAGVVVHMGRIGDWKDNVVGMGRGIPSSRAGEWHMTLNVILAFWFAEKISFVIIAGRGGEVMEYDIAQRSSCRACKLQWSVMLRKIQNRECHASRRIYPDCIINIGFFHFCLLAFWFFKSILTIFCFTWFGSKSLKHEMMCSSDLRWLFQIWNILCCSVLSL